MNFGQNIAARHSNKRAARGQCGCPPPSIGTGRAARALLVALAISLAGCTSIYHRSRADLPPDQASELALRMVQARHAGEQARQAASKLLDHLHHGRADATIAADLDRLEAAAFDVERRALAARDAAKLEGDRGDVPAEIANLLKAAQAWLAYVQGSRTLDRTSQRTQLEALLERPADARAGAATR